METSCAVCHGADGRGGAAGPRIAANELTQPEFIAAVRLPMRTMPAFPEQALSDQGLIQMYDYFQAQGAPSAAAGRAGVGAESYSAYGCYSCHANEAQGGMHGPRLGPDPISFARFALVHTPSQQNDAAVFDDRADGSGHRGYLRVRRGAARAAAAQQHSVTCALDGGSCGKMSLLPTRASIDRDRRAIAERFEETRKYTFSGRLSYIRSTNCGSTV